MIQIRKNEQKVGEKMRDLNMKRILHEVRENILKRKRSSTMSRLLLIQIFLHAMVVVDKRRIRF
jgi:hypothetical protein